MAQLLQVSHVHYRLIELGRRNLPDASFPFFSFLNTQRSTIEAVPLPDYSPHPDLDLVLELAEQRLRKLKDKHTRLQDKLVAMHRAQILADQFSEAFPRESFPSVRSRMDAIKAGTIYSLQEEVYQEKIKCENEVAENQAKVSFMKKKSKKSQQE